MVFGQIAGAAIGAMMGGSSRKSAYEQWKQQMALLERGEQGLTEHGQQAQNILQWLKQSSGRQFGDLIGEARDVGEEQKKILGGVLSSASRRANQLVPQALATANMSNIGSGMSNTTAGLNLGGMYARQAAETGGALEMQGGQMYSGALGSIFGNIADLVRSKIGTEVGLGQGQAAIEQSIGQGKAGIWSNVQVAPAPETDYSWIGDLLANMDFGGDE